MSLKSLGSYTFTIYYDNSTKEVNYQKNPEPAFKIFLDPVFYESDSSFKVSKSSNTSVDYCPIVSRSQGPIYDYNFINLDSEANAKYEFSVDASTWNLTIADISKSTLDSEGNYTIEIKTGYSNSTFSRNISFTETIEIENDQVVQVIHKSAFWLFILVSLISLMLGGTLLKGIWLIVNLQKMLLLFLLIDTYIHPYVRLIITKQNFFLFNFDFLNTLYDNFLINHLFLNGVMNTPQKRDEMIELGYTKESTLLGFIALVWTLILISLFYFFVMIIKKCLINKCVKRENLQKSSEQTSFDNIFYYRDDISENNSNEGSSCCCISQNKWKELCKNMKERIANFLSYKFYVSLLLRLLIESFMGVLIVAFNEVLTNEKETLEEKISFGIAISFISIYVSFFISAWVVCCCHERKREPEQNNKTKKRQSLWYEEFIKDISSQQYAAFHQPLLMTRIVVFVILIMICRESRLASIWLLFTMLIAQFCYLWQEWKFPKFDCKILKCLNWTNELFLTSFMLFFIGFRRYTDYQACTYSFSQT
ncbi:unnamed protein product [Moneuplotes crassus]|uniref:Uncharacterized protein n=1 Tax=Euplotes crassus TaxID=5936 RepID=A0AAD1TYL2_EUPCR|nr:unnamed protein product [Moneuplotes crassus]